MSTAVLSLINLRPTRKRPLELISADRFIQIAGVLERRPKKIEGNRGHGSHAPRLIRLAQMAKNLAGSPFVIVIMY